MTKTRTTKVQRALSSRWVTAGLVAVFALMCWIGAGELMARRSLKAIMAQTQSRYAVALQKQEELREVISLVQSPEYLEWEAKQKLNMKKTGEQVFVISYETKEEKQEVRPPTPQYRAKGWFSFLGF